MTATAVDQGISPLSEVGVPKGMKVDPRYVYASAPTIYRLAVVDIDAPLPAPNMTYFVPRTNIVRSSPTGRLLKKPKVYDIPAAPPGTVAFVDWHPIGKEYVFIDYITVRPDMRKRGLALQLTRALYRAAVSNHVMYVHWGKVMSEHAWVLLERMKKEFPDISTIGKIYF